MFKVMVVDDIEVMRRQIKRLDLWGEKTGFTIVDEAEDGQEALDKLRENSVDLLITDISMPRITGMELLKETYENDYASCVVFLTEHKEFSYAKEAIQYGVFDYLVKPVNAEELSTLLIKVKKYIEQKEDKRIGQMDVYYPLDYLNDITKNVIEGNEKSDDLISKMVETTYIALEYDLIKTALIIKKVYTQIWCAVNNEHKWLETYIDTRLYSDVDFTSYSSFEAITIKFAALIKQISDTIDTFIRNSLKTPVIHEICVFVVNNIEQNINISKISSTLFLTKNYIGDLFKQETGMTLGEYITMVKMERAKKLIREGHLKNYEISQKLDYNDTDYFSKLFKKNTGYTPAEYKKSLIPERNIRIL